MNWTDGYMAEIPYTPGYYRELSPAQMCLAALIRGQRSPELIKPFSYCELGMGYGVTLLANAAAFPHATFYGTDFNPAHAASAQRQAQEAGLRNIHLFDDSFEQLMARDLPQMDFICLHGIFSWISESNQNVILDFIDRRLKPGGIVYISYNALPGWAAAMPMRELMRLHGQRMSAQSMPMLQQVREAVDFMEDMSKREMRYFAGVSNLGERIKRIKEANPNYLAHEYFNSEWKPFYFHEIANRMAQARLSFVGSAHLSDLVEVANLPTTAIQHLATIKDPVMRESVRDYYINQQFRRDLFTRGAQPLAAAEQAAMLLDIRWLMVSSPSDVKLVVNTSMGEVKLSPEAYQPVVDALASGPKSARELQGMPGILQDSSRLLQALTLLSAAGYLQPLLPASLAEAARESARQHNKAVAGRAANAGNGFWVSATTGLAHSNQHVTLLLADAHARGLTDPQAMAKDVWAQLSMRGQAVVKGGEGLQGAEANLAHLTDLAQNFLKFDLPRYAQLGFV